MVGREVKAAAHDSWRICSITGISGTRSDEKAAAAGVLGVPQDEMVVCAAKYKDGDFHGVGGFCGSMVQEHSRLFPIGTKV